MNGTCAGEERVLEKGLGSASLHPTLSFPLNSCLGVGRPGKHISHLQDEGR